ncbi:Cathepsin L1 [Tritrichomonas foetus]|uniref:Cathepsin L1 n=1 Tax=Tritrichomonas foetus TaxID=1144522 RepID=A0A1J4J2H0_9EUKA|nr:Cathepsin L1 [Tritrichomonas foetus]|eukprot:OHS93638.1 Cathepsin L1 [Tritrichomonas foetus]
MIAIITVMISFGMSFPLYQVHEEKAFISWMRSHNIVYTSDEYHIRLGIYLTNARYVQEHNSRNPSFKLSLNKFSTHTPTEYKAILGFNPKYENIRKVKFGKISNPETNIDQLDWRDKGIVNDIKDQGKCGSCWAFSGVQCIESAWVLAGNPLERFSEQSVVDCTTSCGGCQGGGYYIAFVHIRSVQSGKLNPESEYPYTATDGNDCEFSLHSKVGNLKNFYDVRYSNETDLAICCANYGPACCSVDASHASFQLYSSGIYDEPECSKTTLDHGVGLVGYGVENDVKYWIVRNSWGKAWGEEGYIRMLWDNNQCGLATRSMIVTVK